MKITDLASLPLVINSATKRFELEVEGHISSISFAIEGTTIYLDHAMVAPAQRNQGIAAILTEKVLVYVEEHNLKAVLLCSYLQVYVHRHPAWARVVA